MLAPRRERSIERVLRDAERRMAPDGGGLRFHGVSPDGYVRIELTGACAACPRSMMTLDLAVETPLRGLEPGLRGVELVHRAERGIG